MEDIVLNLEKRVTQVAFQRWWTHPVMVVDIRHGLGDYYREFQTTGTLAGLLRKYLEIPVGFRWWFDTLPPPSTPAGIWIDRLQECPEELVGAEPDEIDAILTHLRHQHPNGV